MSVWYPLDDNEKLDLRQPLDEDDVARILSMFPEFGGFEIGEDNDGQLLIYTGLYSRDQEPVTFSKAHVRCPFCGRGIMQPLKSSPPVVRCDSCGEMGVLLKDDES